MLHIVTGYPNLYTPKVVLNLLETIDLSRKVYSLIAALSTTVKAPQFLPRASPAKKEAWSVIFGSNMNNIAVVAYQQRCRVLLVIF